MRTCVLNAFLLPNTIINGHYIFHGIINLSLPKLPKFWQNILGKNLKYLQICHRLVIYGLNVLEVLQKKHLQEIQMSKCEHLQFMVKTLTKPPFWGTSNHPSGVHKFFERQIL